MKIVSIVGLDMPLQETYCNEITILDSNYRIISLAGSALCFFKKNFTTIPEIGSSFFAMFPSPQRKKIEAELRLLIQKSKTSLVNEIAHLLPTGWLCIYSLHSDKRKQVIVRLEPVCSDSWKKAVNSNFERIKQEKRSIVSEKRSLFKLLANELSQNVEEHLAQLRFYQKTNFSPQSSHTLQVKSLEILTFISRKIHVLGKLGDEGYKHEQDTNVLLKDILEVMAARYWFDVSVSIDAVNTGQFVERIILELWSLLQ